MANLVKRNEEGKAITNSLLVAEKFRRRHSDVVKSIEQHIKDIESTDEEVRWFDESTYCDAKGENRKMYIMTRDGFSLLVMSFNNTKDVLKFKLKFIEAFNKMEALLNSDEFILMRSFQIMDKKVKTLECENAKKDEIIELQHETINELAPKADYAEKVLISKDTFTATQIAKELGMGAQTLNRKLKELRVQYKHGGQWLLYARYQSKGYTKTHTYTEDIGGETRTWHSTVWTEKGRKFIHDTIKENSLIEA